MRSVIKKCQKGRREELKGGIHEKALVVELLNGFADGLAGAKKLQVAGMVQVGAQVVDISFFDQIHRQVPGLAAIVSCKRKQIELEITAAIPELIVPSLIA